MKKTYISPKVVSVELNASGLMAMSLELNQETIVDTSIGENQLGRDEWNRGGSVWDNEW